MATPQRRAGIVTLTINGTPMDISGDMSYRVNGVKRETLVGQSGIHDFSEMPQQGIISCNLRDAKNLDTSVLQGTELFDITAILANGKQVVGNKMWLVEMGEVNSQDGTISVRFEGKSVTENLA